MNIKVFDLTAVRARSRIGKQIADELAQMQQSWAGAIANAEAELRAARDNVAGIEATTPLALAGTYQQRLSVAELEYNQALARRDLALALEGQSREEAFLEAIELAAAKLADKLKLMMLLPTSAVVFYHPDMDVTAQFVAQMDEAPPPRPSGHPAPAHPAPSGHPAPAASGGPPKPKPPMR